MKRKRTKMEGYKRFPEPEFLPKIKTTKGVSTWKPEYVRLAFFMSLLGATDVQLAQCFDVSPNTIENWKTSHPEFLQALREGKLEADGRVIHSLYQSAVGFTHKDQVVLTNRIKVFNDRGRVVSEHTEPLIVETMKRYPPNVKAAIKWLSARHPAVWGDKLEVKGKLDVLHKIDLTGFTIEELQVLNKLGLKEGDDAVDTTFEEVTEND